MIVDPPAKQLRMVGVSASNWSTIDAIDSRVGCSVKPEATSSMVEVLTPIWQRVLQLSSIRSTMIFLILEAIIRWLFNCLPKSRRRVIENCPRSRSTRRVRSQLWPPCWSNLPR